ncbi:MAG TPA: CPBP family intramembrane glutamic endopeptidase [Gammaproteobacteria bacterium]|jgi:membrane protease YdiL (CAAX protease family)|nr:CPBP family intramembrane glutamic endopeptidase [Gammaproteobacteria bacterium]
MFNWTLFFILIGLCIPGVLFLIPITKNIYQSLKQKLPATKKMPSETGFIIVSVIQTLILVSIAAAFGVAVSNKTNLHAPFLEALSNGQDAWSALQPQILPSFLVGVGGAVVFLIAYYFVFRPWLDKETIQCMENLRASTGILGRVFYGGIVEEVLCRWGLMMFFVWIGTLLLGEPTPFILWTAILVSGLLFGLGHLPAYLSFGCKKTSSTMTTIITLNLWASIIFGWLFWRYGLCSAIIAHALFHIIWYPFDFIYD